MNGFRNAWPALVRRAVVAAFTASAMVVSLVLIGSPALAATINVNCSTQNLQTKINSAPPGSTLLIKGTCIGNFTVNKNLTLKGNPSATLDGNDAGSTLTIPGVHTVHLFALTITGGSSVVGAGIDHSGSGGGVLTLNAVTVRNNFASGTAFAEAGGIFSNSGSVRLTASDVLGNRAVASNPSGGATAIGGGIVSNGPLALLGSTVSSNRATASSPGAGVTAVGGGVLGGTGSLIVISSHVDANHASAIAAGQAVAIAGGIDWSSSGDDMLVQASTMSGNVISATTTAGTDGATAVGGAIVASFDMGKLLGSAFANNQATAASVGGAAIAVGGGINSGGGTRLTLVGTRITGSHLTATGATTATAVGGGISNGGPLIIRSSSISTSSVRADAGTGQAVAVSGGINQSDALSLSKTTVDQNHVTADSDSNNATGVAGGMTGGDPSTIVASTISRNTVKVTAQGSNTAQAIGGGIDMGGTHPQRITNSTIASNLLRAVSSAATGTASATGGGISSGSNSLLLLNTTVARNLVGGVAQTHTFRGGGLFVTAGTTTLKATILALNTASAAGGPNCSGPVASQGNNVLGTVAGCTFANKPNDKLNRNPKLGALANNGGPTLTLALLNGSPALDVIAPAVCAVSLDQRGVHRPQGPRCDVGSYERHV
jgi:fibronectin-binding autotransporter adhesin